MYYAFLFLKLFPFMEKQEISASTMCTHVDFLFLVICETEIIIIIFCDLWKGSTPDAAGLTGATDVRGNLSIAGGS